MESAGEAAAHQQLARELRRLRAASRKSLKELEPELHVSDSSLSRYLSGRAVPPWTVVARLARLVGREPGELRGLWQDADHHRGRRGALDPPGVVPGVPAAPVAGSASAGPGEGAPRRRARTVMLVAVPIVLTALVAGGLGAYWAGRGAPAPSGSCDGFPTPDAAGQAPVPGVTQARPQGDDHEPTVTLVTGAVDGRPSIWAEITGAQAGDRVWIDWSDTEGVSHTQCGPFGVTPPAGVSRTAEVLAGRWFRACGDTPRAVAGSPRNACTDWSPAVSRRSPPG